MRTLRALTPPTAPPAGFLPGCAYAGARMLWPVCPAAGAMCIGRVSGANEKQVTISRAARCFAVAVGGIAGRGHVDAVAVAGLLPGRGAVHPALRAGRGVPLGS